MDNKIRKIKNCIKGNDYMYYWEWEPELTDGGKLLKYEAVQAEKRIASYTSEKNLSVKCSLISGK